MSRIDPPLLPIEYQDQFPHVLPQACLNGAIDHVRTQRTVACVLMFRNKDGTETVFVSGTAETATEEIDWALEVLKTFQGAELVSPDDAEEEES